MKNIYEMKNYKALVIVPIALLIISLYFIPRIPLDSSLRGGISIQLQTNSTISTQALTSMINSNITGAQTTVTRAASGIDITLAANQSLSNAQSELLGLYSDYGNYSSVQAQIAQYQSQLKSGSLNSTIQAALSSDQSNESAIVSSMNKSTAVMLLGINGFLNKTYSYNSSSPAGMLASAKNAYASASAAYENQIITKLKAILPFSTYTYQSTTPTLGAYFLQQVEDIIIASFIIVAISVFVLFRTPVPSFSVVFGAGNDILVALGGMAIFGIPLGIASIGGLLMLIGYSIDTDMLSAIRILKRAEGTPVARAFATMKTGMTMTFTAIITFSILFIVSYITFIPTYYQISSVVLIGLVADLFTTWFGNTTMVLWYKQRKDAMLR
ncbi:MAG: hypothetical protein M1504_02810 [Candidatus Marsarchaeota archaeon]|nr:hypothetical protein [Candidatus Marsarchaeota archaeon]